MATGDQVNDVRFNTNEVEDQDTYSDDLIADLIASTGSVFAASAEIWDRKAASYAELVDVAEAGASRKLSDLYKNALAMSKHWRDRLPTEQDTSGRAKVHKIVRST